MLNLLWHETTKVKAFPTTFFTSPAGSLTEPTPM
jgi:hypothetical protein